MRLASFMSEEGSGYGIVDSDGILELTRPELPTLRSFISTGMCLRKQDLTDARRLSAKDVHWLPPIPEPDKIICVGLNYRVHAEELRVPVPAYPALFARFAGSQVGHQEPTVCPSVSEQYDYEAELAVIIGAPCWRVEPSQAMEYVAGYSCFADHSVRDWQKRTTQVTAGKNFSRSGAFGPWLTTRDEIPDPASLEIIGRLNGREVQRDRVAGMIFSIPELIAHISTFTALLPGDVIATGTPAGVGDSRRPPLFMRAGDSFEVEIPGVGILENSVIAEDRS
jgi:2-keto-4-pentenoate hydratase/2-oxohepta-3-ene-1,7-dioic acid hydratase in catechol pathway